MSDQSKPLLASITKYVPFEQITHAGGQYAYKHYAALGGVAEIVLSAPRTPDNVAAAERIDVVDSVRLISGRGMLKDGRFKAVADVESVVAGSVATRNVRDEFLRGDAIPQLASAAVIEFQWSEMMALAPLVKDRLPHVPRVGVAHDVITQRWARAAEASNRPMAAAYRYAARRSAVREAETFSALDVTIVFSEKDADLVSRMAPTANPQVVLPGLGPAPGIVPVRRPDPAEPMILFTGALNRGDNHSAALWFIDRVWPIVLGAAPSARLVIAGANPRVALERASQASRRVRVTGYVDSLEPYYAEASVFIAPLATGAGVKFKTIDAMLRSVPIVATPVGAEGIENAIEYMRVAEGAEEFARAVIETLSHPNSATITEAAAWANGAYGAQAFARRLAELYGSLLERRGRV